jgi:hypothetical protein
MKTKVLSLIAIFTAFTLFSCDTESTGKGSASFYLTDGPIEAENVTAVVITFTNVEVSGPDGWTIIKEYDTAQSINLLDLQNGETFFIDEAELTSGAYGQVRLGLLDNEDANDPQNSYISFDDSSRVALTIPSGNQSGYKVVGGFTIPDGGVTAVTIDFDVRKSVVETGSGKYILKPTLRLIENADVAAINGTITTELTNRFVVYAYENDTYDISETEEDADGIKFANAVTSANVKEDGTFMLSFLEAGTYDIYVVAYNTEGDLLEISATEEDVELVGGQILTLPITI